MRADAVCVTNLRIHWWLCWLLAARRIENNTLSFVYGLHEPFNMVGNVDISPHPNECAWKR